MSPFSVPASPSHPPGHSHMVPGLPSAPFRFPSASLDLKRILPNAVTDVRSNPEVSFDICFDPK
jgi:hypothetical protein